MSKLTRKSGGSLFVRRSLARWMFAASCLVLSAAASAQGIGCPPQDSGETGEKTIRERIKEYWSKAIAKTEAGARAAGEDYHKLREKAAEASGPAREKLNAEMEKLSRKWAHAREKLATTVELHMNALHEEYKALEEKAKKQSGPTRDKMNAELHKLHEEWTAARAKMEDTLSANLKSSREEFDHMKEHAKGAAEDARAKLQPHLARLKSEIHKDREKLTEYLEADLKRTKEDMEKLEHATSEAARNAFEKLSAKAHELRDKLTKLHAENLADEER